MIRRMTLSAAGFAVVLATPAVAHHSFAMFDSSKTISLSGTVKEFEWVNPHAWIHLTAIDPETGKPAEFAFEMGSPGQLGARGMKSDSMKPGDKVTVQAHPMKDGTHGGQYMSVTFEDGHGFGNRGTAPANEPPQP